MLSKNAIYEYERLLIGKKEHFAVHIFPDGEEQKDKTAIEIMRYGIEKYLGWSKEQIAANLNYEILKKLKLTELIPLIIHPPEIILERDIFFIINRIFPGLREYDFREIVINVYKKILSEESGRFPKGFFEGEEGELRAGLCLQYAISQEKVFSSLEEAYKFFASPEANAFLKRMRLTGPLMTLYSTPLDYFYQMVSKEDQSEFLYHYARFNRALGEIIKV